jgi:hypothetical protein
VKTVLRIDRAPLRKPMRTSQGFLRVEGHAARAGIYEYRNDDGTTRYELRPLEEVQSPESLASYDAAPVTLGHPSEEVTAENVRRHEVGTVSGEGRADDDHVATALVIKDARAIKQVEAGKQELSPGYRIDLDETPGEDRRYATSSNPNGLYHAVQRKIRVNHLAIVDRARGGSTVRLRMDEAVRSDGNGKLTTAEVGHQHLIDLCDWNGSPRSSGSTSCAVSEGAEHWHEHPWVRNTDGTITIGDSSGHTHGILDDSKWYAGTPVSAAAPRIDGQIDRFGRDHESGPMATTMDPDEQIRSLKSQLAAAEAKLNPLEDAAKKQQARADQAEARLDTATKENVELRAQIAAAATVVETEAIKREKIRADEAESRLRRADELFEAAVDARVDLERKAATVMGPGFAMRQVPERQIIATVVKRLDAQADTSPKVTDDYLRGRFESLIELHARNARSTQNLGSVITAQNEQRADDLEDKRREMRNWGNAPLPNSREAQRLGRGS